MVSDSLYTFATHFAIPFAVAILIILGIHKIFFQIIDRSSFEKLWKVSLLGLGLFGVLVVVWYFITHMSGYQSFMSEAQHLLETGKNLPITMTIALFIARWIPVYVQNFVSAFFLYFVIEVTALIFRVHFFATFTAYILFIIKLPWLAMSYLWGKQAPFSDDLLEKMIVNRVRENAPDALFQSLSGRDERGERYDSGQRGTDQVQKSRSMGRALKNIKVTVRTSGNVRRAEIGLLNPRETSATEALANAMKGVGKTIVATSINFPENFNVGAKRMTMVSNMPYEPALILGDFWSIFENPFDRVYAIKNGGRGAFDKFLQIYKKLVIYMFHFTIPAIVQKIQYAGITKYTIDETTANADYIIGQNLDYSLIPEPDNIEDKEIEAQRVANRREPDIRRALALSGMNVTLSDIKVGGNRAIYRYLMPEGDVAVKGADKLGDNISNLLRTQTVHDVRLSGGYLTVTRDNGVNIPISYVDMLRKRDKGVQFIVDGIIGVDADGQILYMRLGNSAPHALVGGKTGSGKTVTIMGWTYSIMDAFSPDDVQFVFVDGKGNSFEYMRTDHDEDENGYEFNPKSPNPYMMYQPADGSGDISYARAVIKQVEQVVRDRIDLFKRTGFEQISDYNEAFPNEKLPTIVMVVDEFSALTDADNALPASEYATKGMEPTFEYIGKMSRSVGVNMVVMNQTLRKTQVKGELSANLVARLIHGLTEPIESEIALPETGARPDKMSGRGFFSMPDGPASLTQGNAAFLSLDVRKALNVKLWEKFGERHYAKSRQEVLDWYADKYGADTPEQVSAQKKAQAEGSRENEAFVGLSKIEPQPEIDWSKFVFPKIEGVVTADEMQVSNKRKLSTGARNRNTELLLTDSNVNKAYVYWSVNYSGKQIKPYGTPYSLDTVVNTKLLKDYLKGADVVYDEWLSEMTHGMNDFSVKNETLSAVRGNDRGTLSMSEDDFS